MPRVSYAAARYNAAMDVAAAQVEPSPSISRPSRSATALNAILALGIILRLAVLLSAGPFNPDRHFEVIEFVAQHRALPTSNIMDQSYQPPLYYVLMAPLLWLSDGPGLVHLASFGLSVANLYWIRRLLEHPLLRTFCGDGGAGEWARAAGFALLATLPQLIMFASFVSNDSLAMLLGTAIFAAWLGFLRVRTWRRLLLLGLAVGAGLLTKGTFVASGGALACVLPLILWIPRRFVSFRIGAVAAFCTIWIAVGSYKYIENYQRLGTPIVHNQDNVNPTALAMRNTWRGWQTVYDVNVLSLIQRPVIRAYDPSSYPLLLYATFWYSHIPESSFDGNLRGYDWIGRLQYVLGIVPTLVFLGGIVVPAIALVRVLMRSSPHTPMHDVLAGALALFVSNVVIVMVAGIKYQNWSSFQARLCFPSALPMLILFWTGMNALHAYGRLRWIHGLSVAICLACAIGGCIYFFVEIALAYGLIPGGEPQEWWHP